MASATSGMDEIRQAIEVRHAIVEVLEQCLHQQAYSLPLHITFVSANGSMMLLRYANGDQTLEMRVVAEHVEDGIFKGPINFMVTDLMGKASLHEYRPRACGTTHGTA
jgi:hypothetical protein